MEFVRRRLFGPVLCSDRPRGRHQSCSSHAERCFPLQTRPLLQGAALHPIPTET